jgi:hypothetical protein
MLLHSLLVATAARLLRRGEWDDWEDEDEDANCVRATPGPNGNVPITACNSYYNYDPQFAPAVAVAVIFGIFTVVHLVEAVAFKKVSPRSHLEFAAQRLVRLQLIVDHHDG